MKEHYRALPLEPSRKRFYINCFRDGSKGKGNLIVMHSDKFNKD